MDVLRDETGATAIDYGIVVLLISITAATAFDTFGDYIGSLISLAFAD
jgi:Flp pilus assembly pilin Flp